MDGDGLEGMRPSLLKGSFPTVVGFWCCGDEDRVALIVSNGTVALRFDYAQREQLKERMYQSERTMTLLVYGRRWFGRYAAFAAEGSFPSVVCFWFCGDEDRVALIVSNGTVALRFDYVIRVK
ncbi:hypothetical protein CDAR_108931 [Caerostris darwini]|uniref:Uncharacterized protein n=1 Tax=Caerostris darwini TaxID=1538125 RepID=A0AAV4QLR1_9ARAC|nr:hypothetical protein CDAR_108931 [Caerostris darwini]